MGLSRHAASDLDDLIAGIPQAVKSQLVSIRQDERFDQDRTVLSRQERGQPGPQCPQGYYMFRMDVDKSTSTATAACNKCAGCDACLGPRPDDCLACPLDKQLHIDVSGRPFLGGESDDLIDWLFTTVVIGTGMIAVIAVALAPKEPSRSLNDVSRRSVCLDGCPECFIMSDTGKCELDPSAGSSCSHQAAFNPSVMPEDCGKKEEGMFRALKSCNCAHICPYMPRMLPEDRGDPGTCKELEAAKSASPSKTALLSMSPHVSRGRSLLSRRERPQGIDRKDIQLARRTLQALGQEHPAGHSEHALSTLATSLSRRRRGVSKAEHKKREKEKKDKKKKDKKDKKDKKKKDKKKVKIPGMDFVKDLAGPELVKQAKDAMKDWFFGQAAWDRSVIEVN